MNKNKLEQLVPFEDKKFLNGLNWAKLENRINSRKNFGAQNLITRSQIDDYFEGESEGKKQVSWINNVTNKPWVDVREYGLKGDGSANDTKAWNSMVAAINNAQGGKIELTPNATYLLGNVTIFDQLNGMILNFNGATIKIIDNTEVGVGKTGYALRFTNCDNVTINNPKINGNRGGLDYTAGGDGQTHGIFVQYSRNVSIVNPDVYDCATDGIYIGATTGTNTERSQRVKVDGGRVYRCRRNNVTIAGSLNTEINLKENTYAGADVTGSTGTAPKAGIDLEPNASGAANRNENIKLGITKYSDNVSYDIVGNNTDGLFIKDNELSTKSGAMSIYLPVAISNCFIKENYFSGGTFHVLLHADGVYDGLEISNNFSRNASTFNVYLDGATIDNLQFSGNTIIANERAFFLNPTNATNWQSNKVYGNVYILNDDENAADTDVVTIRKCIWENETIVRESGVANNYRVSFSSGEMRGGNIQTYNGNVELYDALIAQGISNIDIILGSRIIEWHDTAAPDAGTWAVGAKVLNTIPVAGGAPGWICTTAGTPGTWKAFANLAA